MSGFEVKVVTQESYVKCDSGLIYRDFEVGKGDCPKAGQQVFLSLSSQAIVSFAENYDEFRILLRITRNGTYVLTYAKKRCWVKMEILSIHVSERIFLGVRTLSYS